MRLIFSAILCTTIALGTACGPSRTPNEAAADLGAGESERRLKAARDIEASAREAQGLPADVTETLLARFPVENDPKTKGSIITALGYTGDPRVKPLLEQYLQTSDPDQQRWGARAYKKYVVKTGQMAADYEFPENWPFGTSGFPPPAQEQ